MRSIAHISDLHFGRHDPVIATGLLADLAAEKPDLIAISGDLTQRARRAEFAAAREFLDRLPAPAIAVPGNHDVPLYNPLRRGFRPAQRVHSYLTPHQLPFFPDGAPAGLRLNYAGAAAVGHRLARHNPVPPS